MLKPINFPLQFPRDVAGFIATSAGVFDRKIIAFREQGGEVGQRERKV